MIAIQHGARALLLVVAGLLLAASTPAAAPQRPVRASATLSTGVLKYGATATLTVEVEDQPDAKLLPASALDGLLRSQPGFDQGYIESTYPFRRPEDRERFLDGLEGAGWRRG